MLFRRKNKAIKAEESNPVVDYSADFKNICEQLNNIENIIDSETNHTIIYEQLKRIENKQKETSFQLEEINEILQDDDEKQTLINSLIYTADSVETLYRFAEKNGDPSLKEQSLMMWNSVKSKMISTGFDVIDESNCLLSFGRHHAEKAEQFEDIKNGYVAVVLKCGYIYNGTLIRKASVIVNKIDV